MSQPTWKTVGMPAIGTYDADPVPLKTAIADMFAKPRGITDKRYPTIRPSTDRKPLPLHIWQVVYRRDFAAPCQICGGSMRLTHPIWLEVDHVTPWSAGGSDRTDNLRLVHKRCNQVRSNFRHPLDGSQLPIVHHCRACHLGWLEVRDESDVPTMLAWCDRCRRVYFGKDEWVL